MGKATGPPGNEFSGNCLGDMYGCGDTFPGGPDLGLWFSEVTGIHWEGLVPSWYPGCSGMPGCSSDCSFGDTLALPPEIPGYGYHDLNGDPLCAQFVDALSGCFSAWNGSACCTGHICQCSLGDFPVARATRRGSRLISTSTARAGRTATSPAATGTYRRTKAAACRDCATTT